MAASSSAPPPLPPKDIDYWSDPDLVKFFSEMTIENGYKFFGKLTLPQKLFVYVAQAYLVGKDEGDEEVFNAAKMEAEKECKRYSFDGRWLIPQERTITYGIGDIVKMQPMGSFTPRGSTSTYSVTGISVTGEKQANTEVSFEDSFGDTVDFDAIAQTKAQRAPIREVERKEEDDSEEDPQPGSEDHVVHREDRPLFKKFKDLAIDRTYGYLTAKMSAAAKKKFDEILQMPKADSSALCSALYLGQVGMLPDPVTDRELDAMKALPRSEWIHPADVRTVLADTVVNRVISNRDRPHYSDPGTYGERKCQAVICAAGLVKRHPSHNVAFTVSSNKALLANLKITLKDMPDLVSQQENKLSLLPSVATHGLFMKFSPQIVHPTTDGTPDGDKIFDQIAVKMTAHGSYGNLTFAGPPIDLMPLAMVHAPSPLARYSLMFTQDDTASYMASFVQAASAKKLPTVSSDKLLDFYTLVIDAASDAMLDGRYVSPGYYLSTKLQYAGGMLKALAQDKGIHNALRVVLNPYGTTTLLLGHALYEFDEQFAAKPWLVSVAGDVANMLRLRVVASDNHTAPGRDGLLGRVNYSAQGVLPFVRAQTVTETSITYGPIPDNDFNGASCYMDLSYNGRRLMLSSLVQIMKQRKANKYSQADYFAHDYVTTKQQKTFSNLFKKDGNGLVEARFNLFVVMCPVDLLDTEGALETLNKYYRVTAVLPGLQFIQTIMLVGKSRAAGGGHGMTPLELTNFVARVKTMFAQRLYLYSIFYNGYVSSPDEVESCAMNLASASPYVDALIKEDTVEKFAALFTPKVKNKVFAPTEEPTFMTYVNMKSDVNINRADQGDDFEKF